MKSKTFERIPQDMKQLGCRWTRPRHEVLEVFQRNPAPLTGQSIFLKLTRRKTDLASVYRTIHLFVKHKILVPVDAVADGKRYELSDRYREHHHHLICQSCGEVEDIRSCTLTRIEAGLARRTGYRILHHDLKFVGLCRSCDQ